MNPSILDAASAQSQITAIANWLPDEGKGGRAGDWLERAIPAPSTAR
jgi:hypothetical protein